MRKPWLLIVALICCTLLADAQNWLRDMRNPKVNFFTVQREFYKWWDNNKEEALNETGTGERERSELWKIYKRWEHDMMPRMLGTNGNRLNPSNAAERDFYDRERAQSSTRSAADWTFIGPPISFDDGGGDSSCGRVNCVRFDPVNHNIIYCGAPSGGLWKSVDFGQSWQLLNTDNLAQIGVSDIAINPQNPNTIYIATGDIANDACFSVGVLKSTDGGQTWNSTGLSWTTSQGVEIARLLMSPLDSNTLYAATWIGIFKTINGGNTWSVDSNITVLNGMEFNPANPNTIYACNNQLYKSTDAGTTWMKLSNGLPDSITSGGFSIGVTPADTTCIYVLVTDTLSAGAYYVPFNGIYRSLNAGDTFTLQSANPDPSNTGTQGTYDLVVGVSPINRDQLVMAAVENAWSSDGGVTWNSPSQDSHVDHHDMRFFPGSDDTVFSADDGGLFISPDAGNTWWGLNNGMHIGQLYNVSSSQQTKYLNLTGRQDEGTLLQNPTTENIVFGGDGLECLIDPRNENNMFFSSEYGFIGSSTDGGQSSNYILGNFSTGANGMGSWNTPFCLNPNNVDTIYVAKDYIYESPDGGNTWNTLNSPPLDTTSYYTEYYLNMVVAPTNPNYIYAGTYYKLYKTTDGGNTFTDITTGLDTPFFSLAVSPNNPNEIWVGTTNGYISKSIDGGAHWSDFSTGLPTGAPFNAQAISPVRGKLDAVYAGMYYGGGIYYRDSTMSSWMPYSTGLPNVSISQIEIDYFANKIRAATYGRDLWESDPYLPLTVPPYANAQYTTTPGNCTTTVQFTDVSQYAPTSWQWYFPGGQPSSSTSENPSVVYPDGNIYTATFIASNANGSDTVQYAIQTPICSGISPVIDNNFISIYPNPNNGNFILSLSGSLRGKVNISVLDNIGQNVYQYTTVKDADAISTECSLALLAKGIYYVHLTSDGFNSVQKLVIGN